MTIELAEAPARQATQRMETLTRVLLVEDNTELRSCIKEALELWGFHVDTAADGIAAVEAAYRQRYRVLVTDLRLPGMGGVGVIRSIRAISPATRVIVITAYPEWSIGSEAREAGALHILHKPLDLKELSDLVELTAND